MRSDVAGASGAARGTNTATLAGECHQQFIAASRAADAREAVREHAAAEVLLQLADHERGKAAARGRFQGGRVRLDRAGKRCRRIAQPEALLQRQLACLDRRLLEPQALTTLLRSADEYVVSKAPQAVGSILTLSACKAPHVDGRANGSGHNAQPRASGSRRTHLRVASRPARPLAYRVIVDSTSACSAPGFPCSLEPSLSSRLLARPSARQSPSRSSMRVRRFLPVGLRRD